MKVNASAAILGGLLALAGSSVSFLSGGPVPAPGDPSPLELQVVGKVRKVLAQGGEINFSALYNSDQFSAEERAFLGRLYEILFAVPAYLREEESRSGKIPSRRDLSLAFGVGGPAIELVLSALEKDARIPPLFTRNENQEIVALNHANLEAFISRRGDGVRFVQWEGRPVPDFRLSSFEGAVLSTADLRGKPALLYFWFTGCPPCVRISPVLAQLHRRHGDRVRFVGFNADSVLEIATTAESRRAYAAQQGLVFDQAELTAEARTAFGNINIFPTLFLLDAQGIVRRHFVNFQTQETLEAAILEVVEGSR
jgi:thiol-disulfide isomerase/thioredoxin